MEIDSYVLLGYAVVWTIFYWFLSQYIAELSRQKWTTWVQSEESDDVLVEALQAVIEEIEDRMHDKLESFQKQFFGSVGSMAKKAKDMDPMTNLRKAAKTGDWPSMMIEYMANKSGLGSLLPQNSPKEGVKQPKTSPNEGLPKPIKGLFKQ